MMLQASHPIVDSGCNASTHSLQNLSLSQSLTTSNVRDSSVRVHYTGSFGTCDQSHDLSRDTISHDHISCDKSQDDDHMISHKTDHLSGLS